MFSGELAGRKNVLEQALYQLNEYLDGSSQSEVAENLRGLYEQERSLLLQREKKELDRQQAGLAIVMIDSELEELRADLKQRSRGKKEDLFAGLKSKRWFFFKNNPLWVFDRQTGFIWPNLDYVELFSGKRNEVVKQITLHELTDWSVPTYREFKIAWEDRSFPFFTTNSQILCRKKGQEESRFQTEEGFVSSIDFSYNTGEYPNCALYPCNRKYETDEFQTDRHNRLYPDGYESERRLLRFFLDNRLIPFLENETQQEIYNKFVRRRELMRQYAKLLEEGVSSTRSYSLPELLTVCRRELPQLPEATTVLQFYQLAQAWLDKFKDSMAAYENENRAALMILDDFFQETEAFSFEKMSMEGRENALARQTRLRSLCETSLESLRQELDLIGQDVAQLGSSLKVALKSNGGLARLAELEKKERPSLVFLLDFICHQLEHGLTEIQWRITHFPLVEGLFKVQIQLYNYYTEAWLKDQEALAAQCEKQGLPADLVGIWSRRWRQEIELIDSRLLPLFSAAQDGVIPDATALFLGQKLAQYVAQVRRFYMEYRLQLYLKYADETNLAIEIKDENEHLLKLTGQIVAAVKSASFDLEKAAAKSFLRQWSEPWLKVRSIN